MDHFGFCVDFFSDHPKMEDSNWLALNRPKRHGAGARMNEILNLNHEVDEFYSTKYGGFNDVSMTLVSGTVLLNKNSLF